VTSVPTQSARRLRSGQRDALFRGIGCARFDATLFAVLAATSAAAVFWFAVPETSGVGSVSIVLALAFVAAAERRGVASVWCVVASALTLSFTVTNWMAGLCAAFVCYRWRRGLAITALALGLVAGLWGVQKRFIPRAPLFLPNVAEERNYVLPAGLARRADVLRAFVFHGTIMPPIVQRPAPFAPQWRALTVQRARVAAGTPSAVVAAAAWAALLAVGLWALVRLSTLRRFRLTLGLTLLGQIGLHLSYGPETFLYALHFTPLLMGVAALGALTPARPLVRAYAVVVILLGGVVV
jgi:hypothetical protein